MIEPLDLAAIFFVLGQRVRDVDGRPDSRQREEPGRGFAMEPDATVGVRSRMNEAFVESIRGRELTPVSHRITGIGFAGAPAVFLLVVNLEIAGRGRGAGFADVALDRHQEMIAFGDIKVLSGEGERHLHLGRIMGAMRDDVIVSRGRGAGHRSAAREEERGRSAEAK